MEFMGLVAFGIMMCYYAYPKKVDVLERKVAKLQRGTGGSQMSKIILDLKGKQCKLTLESMLIKCEILEVDEEWIKIIELEKKDPKTKLIRIDDIKSVEM